MTNAISDASTMRQMALPRRQAKKNTLDYRKQRGGGVSPPQPLTNLCQQTESARQHPMMTPTPRQNIPPWPAIQAAITIPPQRASKDQLSELMVTSRHSSLRSGCKAADAISPAAREALGRGRPRRASVDQITQRQHLVHSRPLLRARLSAATVRRARGEQAALLAYNAHLAVEPMGKLVPGWAILSHAHRAPEIGRVGTRLP